MVQYSVHSGYKISLRYFRRVFKLPYLDIRCLQDNVTENNCKCAHKCLRVMFYMFYYHVYVTHLKDISRCLRDEFFKISWKNTFYFNLLISSVLSKCCVLIFGPKVFTTRGRCSDQKLTLLQCCFFDVGFPTKYQR